MDGEGFYVLQVHERTLKYTSGDADADADADADGRGTQGSPKETPLPIVGEAPAHLPLGVTSVWACCCVWVE